MFFGDADFLPLGKSLTFIIENHPTPTTSPGNFVNVYETADGFEMFFTFDVVH